MKNLSEEKLVNKQLQNVKGGGAPGAPGKCECPGRCTCWEDYQNALEEWRRRNDPNYPPFDPRP